MENIIADCIKIIKGEKNNIAQGEALKKFFEKVICYAIGEALARIDDELFKQYVDTGWRVERRDERTVQTSLGVVTYMRRLMKKEGEPPIYPLDKELGLPKYQRYTPYLNFLIAQVATKSSYRATADAVNTLTLVNISHQQVGNIIKQVGTCYKSWEESRQKADVDVNTELKTPEILYIEGDGLTLKRQGKKHQELHRFQIAEGVTEYCKRRELVGTHYIAEFSHATAVKNMEEYLFTHYDLHNTIVISNSDGGIGYDKTVFDDIIGLALRHEHFIDRYHVNRKISERIGWSGKHNISKLRYAIRLYDEKKVNDVLKNVECLAETEAQIESIELLRAYIGRNWEYLASMEKRGLSQYEKIVGTCESNHRTYSYRMKKQGRAWGKIGGEAMVKIITGLKNGDLRQALTATNKFFIHEPSKKFYRATQKAFKTAKSRFYEGVRHGKITVDAPTSSAVGQLARRFSFA